MEILCSISYSLTVTPMMNFFMTPILLEDILTKIMPTACGVDKSIDRLMIMGIRAAAVHHLTTPQLIQKVLIRHDLKPRV
jgi:hypothetical protein